MAEVPPPSATSPAETAARRTERPARPLDERVSAIDLAAELAEMRGGAPARRGGRHARTLVKDSDLRVVLIALPRGARMEEHHAPGRITIQTLTGRLQLQVAGQTVELPAGRLLTLGRAVPHDVEALEESAFLLTIAWPS